MIFHWLLLFFIDNYARGDDTFLCPSDTGTYRHPDTNTRFYRCVDGKPVLHICTTGIFVPSKGFCLEMDVVSSTTTKEPISVDSEPTTMLSVITPSTTTPTESSTENVGAVSTTTVNTSTITQKLTTSMKPPSNTSTSGLFASTISMLNSTAHPSVLNTTRNSSETTPRASRRDEIDRESSTSTIISTTTSTTSKPDVSSSEKNRQEQKPKAETFQAAMDDDYKDHEDQSNKVYEESSEMEESFKCPNESGFFRHPNNCSRFYWCILNEPTAMFCSEGTAFDPETHVCSWIVTSDGCGGRLTAPTHRQRQAHDLKKQKALVTDIADVIAATFRSGVAEHKRSGRHPRQISDGDFFDNTDGGVDRSNGNRDRGEIRSFGIDSNQVDFSAISPEYQCPGDGFYADPFDCSVFYHCSNGNSYRHQCQPGTAFHKDKFVCSWPVQPDGCGGMLGVPYKAVLEQQSDPSNGLDNVAFQCPDHMEGYYPDEDDCTVFYHCVGGSHYRHSCGNGTAFNKRSGVCSWPMSVETGCGAVLYDVSKDRQLPPLRLMDSPPQQPSLQNTNSKGRQEQDMSANHVAEEPDSRSNDELLPQDQDDSGELLAGRLADEPPQRMADEPIRRGDMQAIGIEGRLNSYRAGVFPQISTASPSSEISDSEKDSDKRKPTPDTPTSKPASTSEKTNSPTSEPRISQMESDDVDLNSGRIDVLQRTSAWPWESVVRKKKTRTQMSRKSLNTGTSSKPSTTSPSPTTQSPATKTNSFSARGISDENSTPNSKTIMRLASTTTTPMKTTTTSATTTKEKSQRVAERVQAETYRVADAKMDFQCPSPSGHFRDPTNCAVYYHCADNVAFRKDCPVGTLYDINQYRCLPIPEVKDCRRVDDTRPDWEEQWLSRYPEMDSYPTKVDKPDSFECETLNGYLKNERDCTTYFECIDGVPYLRKCMTDTVFDDSRKKCTWSSLVPDCRMAAKKQPTEKDFQTREFQCPSADGYYRDPFSCSTYYHCIDNKAIIRVCDPNFFFDPRVSKCRWSRLVADCDANGYPVFLDKLPLSAFVCPLPNGHYRDPQDCSVFYHCLRDVPYRGACRSHHAFSLDTMMCVPRKEVPGCDYDDVKGGKPVPERDLSRNETVSSVDKQSAPSSDEATGDESVDTENRVTDATGFRCPKAHGLYRDPQDCQIFYHCFSGRPFRHECQFGTVFSVQRNLCTWPALVPECQEVTQSQDLTSQDPFTSHETKEWKAQTLPADFKHDHQHDAPTPTRAEKWETSNDVIQRKSDNVTEGQADEVITEDVNSLAGTEESDNSVVKLQSPEASSDGVKRYAVEVVPSQTYSDFICPRIVFDQYFRDPSDCTRFHRCVKGLRFTFDCPRGTFFDPLYNICDFQERVPDCDHEGRRLGSSREPLYSFGQVPIHVYTGDDGEYLSEPSFRDDGEYMSESSFDSPAKNMCPEADGLFPHPSSCRNFVYCSRGTPIVLTCPADLLYNTETMTCDYDENIVCIRYDK